jgi:hypothetical protein
VRDTIFFKLLREDDKEQALAREIAAARTRCNSKYLHSVHQNTFRSIPGSSFGYWVSDRLRQTYSRMKSVLGRGFIASIGASTKSDIRFVRLFSEIRPSALASKRDETKGARDWVSFVKGGEFSPYYSDPHLALNWRADGAQLKAFISEYRNSRGWGPNWTAALNGHSYYFLPGLTWPRRTSSGLSMRVLPAGCVFADKGPALFAPREDLAFLLALSNSRPFQLFVGLNLGAADVAARSYEVGVIQRMPVPDAQKEDVAAAEESAQLVHDLKRAIDTTNEVSHVFVLPSVLRASSGAFSERISAWNQHVSAASQEIRELSCRIDGLFFRLYGFSDEDRATADRELGTEVKDLPMPTVPKTAAADLVSWALGVAVARFDVRLATGERALPDLSDPFNPLPAYSPGMLPGWCAPSGYPLHVDTDGILVDDEGHEDDIVGRVEQVFELVRKGQSTGFHQDVCKSLGVSSLRNWFGKTGSGGFWDDHFKRYSKSRRNAPIYWPLQSPRGLYRAWVYYHRLDQDTLPKLLGPTYLGGKIERVKQAVSELRPQRDPKPTLSRKDETRLAELDELLADLEEFASRIQQIVRLQNERGQTVGWLPHLDDGVVLNAAPLHGLIPWPRKKKRAGKSVSALVAFWQDLEAGKYDWAHMAMRYWPDRVTAKCREDRSLALAHDLDREFFPGLREELREAAASAATDDDETDSDLPYDADAEEEEDEE